MDDWRQRTLVLRNRSRYGMKIFYMAPGTRRRPGSRDLGTQARSHVALEVSGSQFLPPFCFKKALKKLPFTRNRTPGFQRFFQFFSIFFFQNRLRARNCPNCSFCVIAATGFGQSSSTVFALDNDAEDLSVYAPVFEQGRDTNGAYKIMSTCVLEVSEFFWMFEFPALSGFEFLAPFVFEFPRFLKWI